eukprot:TRINITY_DN3947_c0_g2_i1.p1 TRINITY_DN3947_c0_g2~~TRINITY_DN3947_c0_g2_i1.p1  ORF type:complete len:754 (+),score=228.50 TRINITY_DN3947_c0_g2_i1:208-2469(+)
MALPAKEAIVIILDVGKTMCEGSSVRLEGAVKAVTLLVQQKLLFGPKDEIGVVLFGTKGTKNHLEADGYNNITTLRDIVIPDLALLKKIEEIKGEGARADFMDALILGMDLLQKKTDRKKYRKRIFLVTDAGCRTRNKEDVPAVLEQFNKMEAGLNVIGIDFSDEEDEDASGRSSDVVKTATKIENEKLIREFADKVKGVVIPVHRAIEMMSWLRARSVLQRTTYRGALEISSHLSIPVWSYIKTMPRTFPTLKKLSTLSETHEGEGEGEGEEGANEDAAGKGEVLMQRTYHPIADPDEEIPEDERVKGYKYGRTLVPFSKIDAQVLQYKAQKCMQVIGFTKQSNVPRHHFMGNVECIVAEPGDESAAVALSALVHALFETESVCIIRYVKRANSIPHLGVLMPHIKADYECLFYCKLPFAEDIRQYPFASLDPSRARKAFVPSPEQLAATERLINSLDLMTAAKDDDDESTEALKPKYTYNPSLQHFYQAIQKRALNPKAHLPKLDPIIEKYINPDEDLFRQASDALKSFQQAFPLTKTEAAEQQKRRFWKDNFDDVDVTLDSYIPDPKKHKKDDKISIDKLFNAGGTSEVGSIKPVQDFKEMIARRDVDLVDKAIQQMEERIVQLINDSIGSQLYPKAIECLNALRAACIKEEESEEWNRFLRKLKSLYAASDESDKSGGGSGGKKKAKSDFWFEIVKRAITLIDYDEGDDSDVSPDEAKAFLADAADTVSDEPQPSRQEEDTDDLFDMVE